MCCVWVSYTLCLDYFNKRVLVEIILPTWARDIHMIAGSKSQVKMMVPKRLRAARQRAGLSQEKFLQLTNVEAVSDKSQISNYESGRHSPPFEFVVQIAKALNYPEAYFYTVDDDFAEHILLWHRNRNNPDFNPYYKPLKEALDAVNALKTLLDKATGIK